MFTVRGVRAQDILRLAGNDGGTESIRVHLSNVRYVVEYINISKSELRKVIYAESGTACHMIWIGAFQTIC
jgi:hypothetical protein